MRELKLVDSLYYIIVANAACGASERVLIMTRPLTTMKDEMMIYDAKMTELAAIWCLKVATWATVTRSRHYWDKAHSPQYTNATTDA